MTNIFLNNFFFDQFCWDIFILTIASFRIAVPTILFCAGNQSNHQNFEKCLLFYNYRALTDFYWDEAKKKLQKRIQSQNNYSPNVFV